MQVQRQTPDFYWPKQPVATVSLLVPTYKAGFYALILVLIFMVMSHSVAFGQQAAADNRSGWVSLSAVESNTRQAQAESIQVALAEKVKQAISDHAVIQEFSSATIDDTWGFGLIVIQATQTSEPEPTLFVGKFQNGQWLVELESSKYFLKMIADTPTGIVGNTKQLLLAGYAIQTPNEPQHLLNPAVIQGDGSLQLSLPWTVGETWNLTGGPHPGCGDCAAVRDSVDFNKVGAGQGHIVRAAKEGTAYRFCGAGVYLVHSGGWRTDYFHLVEIPVSDGTAVARSAPLGKTSADGGTCGGSATAAHVHFGIRYNGQSYRLHGVDIGGWTIEEGTSNYDGCMTRVSDGLRRCRGLAAPGEQIYNDGAIGSGIATDPEGTVIVDNEDPGFTATSGWRFVSGRGYGGDIRWTQNATNTTEDHAEWRPTLAYPGAYEVLVYFDFVENGLEDTFQARYSIFDRVGPTQRTLTQNNKYNLWHSLGIYNFDAGSNGFVQLGDATGETYQTRSLLADVVKFVPRRDAYKAEFVSQSYNPNMLTDSTQSVQLTIKNIGSAQWDDNTRLAPTNPKDQTHSLYDPATWLSGGRIQAANAIAPGQQKTFNFNLKAPSTPGIYRIEFNLVQESFTWFSVPNDGAWWFEVNVQSPPPTPTPTNTPTPSRVPTTTPTFTPSPTFTGSPAALPDLLVQSMGIELENTGSCFNGEALGIRVIIANGGNAAAGAFVVAVDDIQQTVSEGLAAGATRSLWYPNYRVGSNVTTVDVTAIVAESNENNNAHTEILPIPTPPATCTPTATPTAPTATWTATATPTSTPTNTPIAIDTPTSTPTYSPTPLPSNPNEIVVDDGDPGFSSSANWRMPNAAKPNRCLYAGDARWTYNATNSHEDWAQWRPNLPRSGKYEVQVYLPEVVTGIDDTNSARYFVHSRLANLPASTVRQNNNYCKWISLGQFDFDAGSEGYVRLVDSTGEAYGSRSIIADAVKFVRVGDASASPPTPTPIPPISIPKPVLVVHGWQGTGANYHCPKDGYPSRYISTSIGTNLDDLPEWFKAKGYGVWLAYLESNPYKTDSLEANANCLLEQVQRLYEMSGNQKLIIIAHSMGGLVSRACLNKPECRTRVQALYTLGSPHGGLNAVDSLSKQWIASYPIVGTIGTGLFCWLQSGACQMNYSNMRTFNSQNPNQSGIKYVFVGGDSSPNGWSIPASYGIEHASRGHDGLVARESAIGMGYYAEKWQYTSDWFYGNNRPYSSPLLKRYWTDEVHVPDWGNAYQENRNSRESNSFSCIAYELWSESFDSSKCRVVTEFELAQNAAVSPETIRALQSTASITGELTANQVVTHSLMIDSGDVASFVLLASANKVDFALVQPDGQIITPALTLEQVNMITFTKVPFGNEFPAQASYVISNALPGPWQLQIHNLSEQTETVRYVAYALFDSPRQFFFSEPESSYTVGSTAVFTASLRNAEGHGIVNAQIVARINRPDGVIDTINFSDWGNGEYRTAYFVPNVAGYAMMSVDVSGSDNAITFTRHIDKLWTINPNSATFTRNVVDRPIDEDGDGLFDKLAVRVEVNVTQPATYTVVAQMMANGVQVDSSSSGLQFMSAGNYASELLFDGFDINAIGTDTNLVIGNAQILDVTHGDIVIATETTLYTTQTYRPQEFVSLVNQKVYLPLIEQ